MKRHLSDGKKETLLIVFCFLVYTISYICRYSYNSNVNAITAHYGISDADFGLVGSFFFAMYGIGQFVNGVLCHKYNKRIVMPIVLLVSASLNLVIFFQPDFSIYKYLWLVNGAALSFLWSSLCETISKNISKESLKKAIVIISASVATGTLVTYGLSALLNEFGVYQYLFLIATVTGVSMAAVWFFAFPTLVKRDNPVIMEEEKVEEKTVEKTKGTGSLLVATLIMMGVLMVVTNLVKDGLGTWVPKILKVSFGLKDSFSLVLTLVLPIFGIFSSIFVVVLNGKIKNYMVSSSIYFAAASAFMGLILLGLNQNVLALSLIMFGLITFLMHCTNSLFTSVAPMELRSKFNAGLTSGVLNGCGYIGSTISSYGLGVIADNVGWNGVVTTLLACCGGALLVSIAFVVISLAKNKRN